MEIRDIPFGTTDWNLMPVVERPGATGVSRARTRQWGNLRVRMVEYSPDYLADHWCEKGHILLCLDGVLHTELADGSVVTLTAGTSYQVADGVMPHRSSTPTGARLFIVD